MKNRAKLDAIANGFYAANKIRNTYRDNMRQSEDSNLRADKAAQAGQVIDIIAQYSPQRSKESLRKTIDISNRYADTYKNLKHHLNSRDGGQINRHNFVKTLSLIEPIVGEKEHRIIEKIMKLYDLFS